MEQIEQACVIPVRRRNGKDEVCLITSIRKKRWIFPKGIVEPGDTLEETGLKEAWEEAGLRGEIVGPVLGKFRDEKWDAQIQVKVMVMEVTEQSKKWPEHAQRKRRWCSIDESLQLLHRRELRKFAQKAACVASNSY